MTAHDIEVVSAWLGQTWATGIVAIGGCDAEGKIFSRALENGAAAGNIDQCWSTLNEAIAQMAAYNCGEERTKWVFETAILFVGRRSDGAWAGILTPREFPQSLHAVIESRLAQFISAAA